MGGKSEEGRRERGGDGSVDGREERRDARVSVTYSQSDALVMFEDAREPGQVS